MLCYAAACYVTALYATASNYVCYDVVSVYVASALALELGVSRENLLPIPKEGANVKNSWD